MTSVQVVEKSVNATLTLMITSAQVAERSVNVTSSNPSQDYTHLDDHNLHTYDMTPGFKPTSFPGSLIFWPPGAREERPWFDLVTCLPDFSRLQISGLREGQISGEFVST